MTDGAYLKQPELMSFHCFRPLIDQLNFMSVTIVLNNANDLYDFLHIFKYFCYKQLLKHIFFIDSELKYTINSV